jgi:hypothetical protein
VRRVDTYDERLAWLDSPSIGLCVCAALTSGSFHCSVLTPTRQPAASWSILGGLVGGLVGKQRLTGCSICHPLQLGAMDTLTRYAPTLASGAS